MRDKVYLIDMGKWTKIGVSHAPSSRLKSLQTAMPLEATLASTISSSSPYLVERTLHRHFVEYQTPPNNEWFDLPDEDHIELVKTDRLTPPEASERYPPPETKYVPVPGEDNVYKSIITRYPSEFKENYRSDPESITRGSGELTSESTVMDDKSIDYLVEIPDEEDDVDMDCEFADLLVGSRKKK